ncbi:fimbrial protein [Enterobacillus tribolii]|uniref:Type 1 fimbria pilin n=1 Tax=Enterobacillus tribolii TaxID=1487935 RepID=A0A370Q6C0_9GAMM|nr:fimbrial protein [Enterobacillus tribolii]MBW7984949.1 type 1 fimbrial protein [Enterobacillus tribolii]RDK83911.1 type 1 fimbria pilin [Enterobacillus tribolii]
MYYCVTKSITFSVRMRKMVLFCAESLLLFLFSVQAHALIHCSATGPAGITDILNIAPANISAGADVPVGGEVYKGRYERSSQFMGEVSCISNRAERLNIKAVWRVTRGSAYGMADPVPGSPDNGRIYKTSVPGIGVVVSAGSSGGLTENVAHTLATVNEMLSPDTPKSSPGTVKLTAYATLVKIGPVQPGIYTFSDADFPQLSYRWENNGSDITGLPHRVVTVGFSGNITMNVQTCQTPDVNVALGSHDITRFTNVGATTSWVDASIVLVNCPVFHGYYKTGNPSQLYLNGPPATPTEALSNSVRVRITPATQVVNAAAGIMTLSPDANAASGVGIQLGWGSADATPVPFDFSGENTLPLPKTGQATIRIPVSARYIATENTLTPGKANGAATFMVNYY